MNVLVINCSPKQTESSSYYVAQSMIATLSNSVPVEVEIIDATRLPHIDSAYADALCSPDCHHDLSVGSLALSEQLIASLDAADMVIIASPMHNYSVPSSLKSWIDHVVRAGKTFKITATGKHPLLEAKPVYILVSSGSTFSGEAAYQPDFFTPYMKAVLATIGQNQVFFFPIEGTVSTKAFVQQKIETIQRRVSEHLATTVM